MKRTHASVDALGELVSSVGVAREDRGSESVCRDQQRESVSLYRVLEPRSLGRSSQKLTIMIIGDEESLFLGLVGKKREDGAEHLLLVDTHLAGDTLQEERLHNIALDVGGSGGDLGALAQSILHNIFDALGRSLGEEPAEGSLVDGVARCAKTGHVGLEDAQEFLGDGFVDDCEGISQLDARRLGSSSTHWQSA